MDEIGVMQTNILVILVMKGKNIKPFCSTMVIGGTTCDFTMMLEMMIR